MFSHLEKPSMPRPGWREMLTDFGPRYAASGFIGMLFCATAPVAIILSVGTQGGLNEAQIASWIFGAFFINGLISIFFCWLYRQPLVLLWTIPGAVLVGPALSHLSFAEVVGAYYMTGLLMLMLGATDWVKRAMYAVPMPIVMGMVAGVFLRFGLDLVRSLHDDAEIVAPMITAWLLLSTFPRLGRRVPPLIGALIVGMLASILLGRFDALDFGTFELARPVIQAPDWSWGAMFELVVPLAVTVLAVQNGQGIAILKAAGHSPPIDAITVACGVGSMASAIVGGVSTCLTGPTNAIITSSGEKSRHYTAGIFTGVLAVIFGLLSPLFTRVMLQAPKAFIMALAGLAMLRILQAAFVSSFQGRFTLGALVAFLVTVADIGLLNVGAAFWGLLAGLAIAYLLERSDFQDSAYPSGSTGESSDLA